MERDIDEFWRYIGCLKKRNLFELEYPAVLPQNRFIQQSFFLPGIIVTRSGQILHPYTPFSQVGYVKQEIKHEIHLKGPLSRIGLFQKCLFNLILPQKADF